MRELIRLTLPYPPSVNTMYQAHRGRVHLNPKHDQWKTEVGWICRQQHVEMIKGNVSLTVHVFRPQHTAKQKTPGDLDNRIKIICDALKGQAIEDDEQITEIHMFRHDTQPKHPRCEITLQEIAE